MGTNYYLESVPCPHCGRVDESRHIGKSSAGWVFALHVYPDEGINDLYDWIELLLEEGTRIKSEYGEELDLDDMLSQIMLRGLPNPVRTFELEWLNQNDAQPGPNGLARHNLGRFCIAHGHGTWDCIVGEFS